MFNHAHPTSLSAAASLSGAASPSLALLEARQLRDSLKTLLRAEQAALADFLIALAEFDARRGWEALGHASLFAFLNVELGLTPAPTYWRVEAARLLQRFPDLAAPVRQGRLCLTTLGELAKVLTVENCSALLPRFLGISSREAKEIVAELQPRPAPPMRTVVTPLAPVRHADPALAILSLPMAAASVAGVGAAVVVAGAQTQAATQHTDSGSLWAPKVEVADRAQAQSRRDDVDPLTAELSRLSTTVSRRFLQKLKAARSGLGHAIPGATTEQVLEAALDLLLERQAKARAQVKRPRAARPTATAMAASTGAAMATVGPAGTEASNPISTPTAPAKATPDETQPSKLSSGRPEERDFATDPTIEAPTHRRDGPREAIPAAVRRAVWERDGGRCSWPIDGGGCCGSSHRLELDHVVPWARFGGRTEDNLRLLCGRHNRLAARQAFGGRCAGRYASRPG